MSESKKVLMYDPPEGWKYGFPKPVPDGVRESGNVLAWIVSQGYPQKVIDSYGKHFYCRCWEEEDEDRS